MYSKHIYCATVCDSNIRVPVTLVKHRPIQYSCDLDGYGLISAEPSCGNKWHFKKPLSTSSCPKVDTCAVEGGRCWNESCMVLCITWSDEHLFPCYWHLWRKITDFDRVVDCMDMYTEFLQNLCSTQAQSIEVPYQLCVKYSLKLVNMICMHTASARMEDCAWVRWTRIPHHSNNPPAIAPLDSLHAANPLPLPPPSL